MPRVPTTSITITDPLIKYRTLVTTKLLHPDPAQLRLAKHLQTLYHRLKDYTPETEYLTRLRHLTQALESSNKTHQNANSSSLSHPSHPIRRNPLFARFLSRNEPGSDTRALVRTLTSHQGALEATSPQGLFLSGDVGTGKSMLLDLLADGLPTQGKKRWHFNTFMLYAFSQLEKHRKSSPRERDPSLLWLARTMIEKSPVLFLDEFQLPDRASSKIVTNLFTVFFRLGGVLVASSNRVPEDLENALGGGYAMPEAGGIISQVLGLERGRGRGVLFGRTSDFASFLEVLRARCEFWKIEGGNDWRREGGMVGVDEVGVDEVGVDEVGLNVPVAALSKDGTDIQSSKVNSDNGDAQGKPGGVPSKYFLPSSPSSFWTTALSQTLPLPPSSIPWKPTTVTVYGRLITIPRQHSGTCSWTFDDLVDGLGPADYITLASTFHTFIIDAVPILTLAKKNEARRFITLLDALYECRCKLFIRAEVGPDDLFFPEIPDSSSTSTSPSPSNSPNTSPTTSPSNPLPTTNPPLPKSGATYTVSQEEEDVTYSETISEVYQDSTSPFRPNISFYSDSTTGPSFYDHDTSQAASKKDFRNVGAFTGEDERFAYKRAASRLWEMCGGGWHARGNQVKAGGDGEIEVDVVGDGDRDGESNPEWWSPLPKAARHWEKGPPTQAKEVRIEDSGIKGDISFGACRDVEEPSRWQRVMGRR